jgi:hypothetical protein
MAYLDRATFKILSNVMTISRELPKHFYYLDWRIREATRRAWSALSR